MLVYLDTNIWVYAYENDPTFGGWPIHDSFIVMGGVRDSQIVSP